MQTKSVRLADATIEEMREFATETLGLDLSPNPNTKADTIRARIAEAWDKPEITVKSRADVGPAPQGQAVDEAPAGGEPMVTLEIARTDDVEGSQPVWVAVNGRGMWIPRGERVTVKHRYYEVLKNAVRRVGEQQRSGEIVWREVQSYSFSVVTMPTEQEIEAWAARQANRKAA